MTGGGPGTITEATNYYAYLQGFTYSLVGFSAAISVVVLAAIFPVSAVIVRRGGAGRCRVSRRARDAGGGMRAPVIYGALASLLVVDAFPVLWLVQMSLKTEVEAIRMPPRLFFVPDPRELRRRLPGQVRPVVREQRGRQRPTTLLAMLLGVPAAYALSRAGFRADRASRLDPDHADGPAHRLRHPVLPRLSLARAHRHAGRPRRHLPHLQPVARDLDDADVLRRSAAVARGGGAHRRGGPAPGLLRVTLPLSGPGLATTAIFCFLFAWNDFFYALVLTRSRPSRRRSPSSTS